MLESIESCERDIITLKSGFWREVGSDVVKACSVDLPFACKGGNSTVGQCAAGHVGPMCGICEDGHMMNSLEGQCELCTADGKSEGIGLITIVGTCTVVVGALFLYYRKKIDEMFEKYLPFIGKIMANLKKCRVKIKIVVTFFQIVSQQAKGLLTVKYPDVYLQVSRKFDMVNLNFVSLASAACVVKTNYHNTLFTMTMVPIALSGLIFLYYICVRIYLTAQKLDLNGDGTLDWSEISTALRCVLTCSSLPVEYEDVVVELEDDEAEDIVVEVDDKAGAGTDENASGADEKKDDEEGEKNAFEQRLSYRQEIQPDEPAPEAGTELVLIQPLDQRDLEVLCAAPTPASNAPGLATTGPIAHLFCGSSGDTNRPTEANERWEVDVVREDEQQ